MRTIDRLYEGGHEPIVNLLREMRAPALVVDNVAQYCKERFEAGVGQVLDEYPSLAPPWPVFWLENRAMHGQERRGIVVVDVTEEHHKEWLAEAPVMADLAAGCRHDVVANGGSEEDIRWLLSLLIMIEDRRAVHGPIAAMFLALDDNGRMIGNRWGFMREVTLASPENYLLAMVAPALQTISFLHCKNVATEVFTPPAKLSAKHRKRTGRDLVRYQTVRLEVPGKARAKGVPAGYDIGSPALHIARGHLAHYGNCCPGVHPPKGKLFGKLEGIYWVPMHVRGSKNEGQVLSDYEIVVAEGA